MSDENQTYKVVFSGNTIEGNTTSDVAKRFAEAFKLNDQTSIEQLFSGKVITLKRGLNYEQAQRYSRILQKLGADCCIECESAPLFGQFDAEPDYDYERKKRRRVAQFSQGSFANVGLAPK
jgi:hypothetical protein